MRNSIRHAQPPAPQPARRLGQAPSNAAAAERQLRAQVRRIALAGGKHHHRGSELHGEVAASALRHYLDATPAEEEYLRFSADQLGMYAGRYDALIDDVQLSVRDGDLVLETVRRGNPLDTQPEPPWPPAVRLAFRGEDKVVALDPPFKGSRGEFLRHPDASIAWLRWGGRIHARRPVIADR